MSAFWVPYGRDSDPHRDAVCLWWVVPKTADETYIDMSGNPIPAKDAPHMVMGKWGSWSSLHKATHWHPLPNPPPFPASPSY